MAKKKTGLTDYTPEILETLKKAMKRYALQNNIQPEDYHLNIKHILGIPASDKRLHSSDPRHWFKPGGSIPNEMKLDLYSDFIRKVYPELKLNDGKVQEYINLGVALKELTHCENPVSDAQLRKRGKALDGKIYNTSLRMEPELGADKGIVEIISFRWIATTPFLLAYRFPVIVPYEVTSHFGKEFPKPSISERMYKAWEKTQETVLSEEFIQDGLQKAVLSPLPDGSGYHGIFKTGKALPDHATLTWHYNELLEKEGLHLKIASDIERYAEGLQLYPMTMKSSCFSTAIQRVDG